MSPTEKNRINPYAPTPTEIDDHATCVDHELTTRVKKRVSRPATAMLLLASIHSVFPAIALVSFFVDMVHGQSVTHPVGPIIGFSFQFILLIAISIGAAKLGHLESYRFGRFAAVCSCIPGISPFVFAGIPFGIWALRVLADPEVKQAFPDRPR